MIFREVLWCPWQWRGQEDVPDAFYESLRSTFEHSRRIFHCCGADQNSWIKVQGGVLYFQTCCSKLTDFYGLLPKGEIKLRKKYISYLVNYIPEFPLFAGYVFNTMTHIFCRLSFVKGFYRESKISSRCSIMARQNMLNYAAIYCS